MTMFALRSLNGLGANNTSDRLASYLSQSPLVIQELAGGIVTGGLALVPYPGYQGRKRFLGKLRLHDGRLRYDHRAKGFGWLSTGIGYYSPVAVLGLLRYFAMKRHEDQDFLTSLSDAAAACAQLHLARKISITNQSQLGMSVLATTSRQYLNL